MTSHYIALFRLAGCCAERSSQRRERGLAFAQRLLEAKRAPASLTLLIGVDEPREMKLHREGDDFTPPHDFAVKCDFGEKAAFLDAVHSTRIVSQCADWSAYDVDDTVKKNDRDEAAPSGEIPGIHMLHPLYFHDDLPLPVLLRSWKEIHGDLAVRVHVGAEMYRQHLVRTQVAEGAGAPFGGFSEFHFPSMEALLNGYFDSDRGRMEIRHDIRHFIKGFPARMFAIEHRLSRAR